VNFENINVQITAQEILSKISEYDIFKRYCSNFKEIDVSFYSDLRITDTQNCRIYANQYNTLRYKDFKTSDNFDCFNYIMRKFNCTYYEAINIISADFSLNNSVLSIEPRIITANDEFKLKISNNVPKEKSKLLITKQSWNIIDYNFWNQYEIDFNTLDFYNVVSAKYTFLIKNGLRHCFNYSKNKPRYAYLFNNSTKAYSPYGDKLEKWMYDGDSDNVEGWDQLDETGDYIVLTKGMKDVMNYHKLDINAISLPSESSMLKENLVLNILERFNKIIINLDNDKQGIISTEKIISNYNFNHFYIDDYKDLSDWIKHNSLEQAKKMIDGKIRAL
jgi:hypothetical protein